MDNGNHKITFLAIGFVALVTIACPWGTFRAQMNTPLGPGPVMEMTMTGTNGNISLLGVQIPNWLTALTIIAASAVAFLRVSGVLEVPAAVVYVLFGLPALFSVVGIFVLFSGGAPGIGLILAAAASIAGLVFAVKTRQIAPPDPA